MVALLLNDAFLRGILAVGMLDHGLCIEENEIKQVGGGEEEGKELSEATLAVGASEHAVKTPMRSSSTKGKLGHVMTEAVLKAEQQGEDGAKIEEKPLLMEEGRTILADMFAVEPFVADDAGEERRGYDKGSAGCSQVIGCKEEPRQKARKFPPVPATRNLNGASIASQRFLSISTI